MPSILRHTKSFSIENLSTEIGKFCLQFCADLISIGMANNNRYSDEQRLDLLKKIATLRKSGDSIEKACAKVKLSVPTYYFWRKAKPGVGAKAPAPVIEAMPAEVTSAGKTSAKAKSSTLKSANPKKAPAPKKAAESKIQFKDVSNKAAAEKSQPKDDRNNIGSFFSKDKVAIILIDKEDLRKMFSNL